MSKAFIFRQQSKIPPPLRRHLPQCLGCLMLMLTLFTTSADARKVGMQTGEMPDGWLPPQLTLLSTSLSFGSLVPFKEEEVTSSPINGMVDTTGGLVRLGLILPNGQASHQLEWVADALGRAVTATQGGKVIPLQWELRWRGGASWGPWVAPVKGNLPDQPDCALWWELGDGSPRGWEFELRGRIKPDRFLIAGRYAVKSPLQLVCVGSP